MPSKSSFSYTRPSYTADRRGRYPWDVLGAVITALGAAGAVVYAPRIAHGGFAWDDWEKAGEATFMSWPGTLGPIDIREAVYEPGLAVLLPLPHMAFGADASLHAALAVALGIMMCACVFVLLRQLDTPIAIAAGIAGLSLVFPWSDSVRLWATAGMNQVSVSLLLLGAALALQGMAESPSRGSFWRRWSLVAYIASMLSYPVTPVLVAASTLLYRVRVPWRRAWEWGRQDLIAALAVAVYVGVTTTKPVQSVGDQIEHAGTILEGWVTLIPRAIVPFGHTPRGLVWGCVAAIILVGWVALRRGVRRGAANDALRLGLALAAVGLTASLIAYAVFVPGEAKYHPLSPGIYNRAGIVAGPAVSAAVVGLLLTVVALVLGRRTSSLVTQAPAVALAFAIGIGWAGLVRDDIDLWRVAGTESDRVLAALDDGQVGIPDRAVVLTVGHPHTVAPGVPVFAAAFDLEAAFMLRRDSTSVHAYPLDVPYRCESRRLVPVDSAIEDLPSPDYGRLWVLDVENRFVWRIRSLDACRRTRAAVASRIDRGSLVPAELIEGYSSTAGAARRHDDDDGSTLPRDIFAEDEYQGDHQE